MKGLCSMLVLAIALFFVVTLSPLRAADLSTGEKIFNANCSTCHIGGNNIIVASKSLKKEALEKHGMTSLAAIQQQVALGHHAMPAFSRRLNAAQIETVATYVLQQSSQGW